MPFILPLEGYYGTSLRDILGTLDTGYLFVVIMTERGH